MASASKTSLMAAACVAAVEALKDQAGLCRWNYALRSLHHRAKHSIAPFSQTNRMSSAIDRWRKGGEGAVERAKRTEESMTKIIGELRATSSLHSHSGGIEEMGCASVACLVVVASMSAVEALKDQAGLCRWNYVLKPLQQRAKSIMGSLSQAKRTSSSVDRRRGWQAAAAEREKQSEEALRTVMYLSCWGPN
ncbi:unnamed protein product [Musa acuminata var. zebrina]